MHAVIMSGGSGTRFWPESRKRLPKQFLDITGRGPMVVETCDRLASVCRDEEMILVLGKEHLEQAERLFAGRRVHLVAEPVGRNTAPCIGLGALYARYLGCRGAVAFLPADHFIGDLPSFLKALSAGAALAETGGIVTLGIPPDRPETGYGYIRRDDARVDAGGLEAYRVSEFVEKPDLDTARGYLAGGRHYWNGGIFIATPGTILKEIERLLPRLYEGLMRLEGTLGTEGFETALTEVYNGIEPVSFDYGIMEKTQGDVYVVPCRCAWSDVGSWSSLYELRTGQHDPQGNLADGETLLVDCRRNFVSAGSGRLVACLGIRNCLVVDTPEALLVADLDRSQEIRKIVDCLKERGLLKLL